MQSTIVICITYTRQSNLKANLDTLESDRPHHNLPPADVIAQQYSFSTFVSLHFHSCKENFGTRLIKIACALSEIA
jgi:hypothetical protein